jgi:hypothetical protein
MFWRDALLILWNMKTSVWLTSSSIWSSSSGVPNTRSAADDIVIRFSKWYARRVRDNKEREEKASVASQIVYLQVTGLDCDKLCKWPLTLEIIQLPRCVLTHSDSQQA